MWTNSFGDDVTCLFVSVLFILILHVSCVHAKRRQQLYCILLVKLSAFNALVSTTIQCSLFKWCWSTDIIAPIFVTTSVSVIAELFFLFLSFTVLPQEKAVSQCFKLNSIFFAKSIISLYFHKLNVKINWKWRVHDLWDWGIWCIDINTDIFKSSFSCNPLQHLALWTSHPCCVSLTTHFQVTHRNESPRSNYTANHTHRYSAD